MKASELKSIKAVEAFVAEYFPKYGNYKVNSSEVSKTKDVEKGDFCIEIDVKPINAPDVLDDENFSTIMKKKMIDLMKKDIRWFNICWEYHTDPVSIMKFNICFKVV